MAIQRKVGLKIEIDGEAEYKKAIQNINRDNQLLNAELKTLAEQYKNNSDSMDYLVQRGEKLESQLLEQEAKVTLLRDALRKATEEFGTADERTTEWAIKLANAETGLAKTKNAIDDNNAAIEENTTALEKNKKAVGGLGDQLDSLTGTLGIRIPSAARDALNEMDGFGDGTLAAMGVAAGGVAAVLEVTKELYELTKQAAQEADALVTRSAQTGLSLELLQQLDYAQQFLDFDGIDRSLQRLTESMGKAKDASSKQAEAFETLGVEIYDENGKLRDNYSVFLDVIDALGAMDDETQRDIIANQLFGRSFTDLKPLIQAGSDELKKYTDRAKEMGYVLDDEVIRRLARFDDALQENKSTIGAAKSEIGGFFAPIFQSIVEGGTAAINTTRELFGNETFQRILKAANPLYKYLSAWSETADAIYDARDAEDAVADSTENTAEKIAQATTPMNAAVTALADKYKEALETARNAVEGQFTLFEDASDRLVSGSERTQQALEETWNKAYEAAERSLQGHFGLFDEASAASEKTADDIIASLESQIAYWDTYQQNLETLLNSGIDGIQEFADQFTDGSAKSAEALATFASATDEQRQAIVDSWQALQDKQGDLSASIADMATSSADSAGEMSDAVTGSVDSMISAQESQAAYWEQYANDFDARTERNITGIEELAANFIDGSDTSKDALASLATASDEEITKLIESMDKTEDAKEDLEKRFADLAVDVPGELEKIKDSFEDTVEDINQAAGEVDFTPFETSVDNAFAFLEERAGGSVETVRGWLATLSAEIDAVEARAASVQVGHNAGGTDNWRGGATWVGESGPELVSLPQGTQIRSNQESRQAVSAVGTDTRALEDFVSEGVKVLRDIRAEFSDLRMRGRMA